MEIFVGIVVIGILIVLILWFNRNQAPNDRQPSPRRRSQAGPDVRFHAVSIKFASTACDAAKALEDQRFLSNAAPRIPLPECTVRECECRFIHYEDRRGEDDRKRPDRQSLSDDSGEDEKERRLRGERRSDGSEDYF